MIRSQTAASWRDYLQLTKPRVISLLLYTTLASMIIAARGWPGTGLFVAVALGGYLMAGAANAFNMVLDADIDGRMGRTARRPTVTQKVPPAKAFVFASTLALLGFLDLWFFANVWSALLSLMGLLWYVGVYTLFMKRRFWNNIVIGGAAGAFPVLVGWSAVAGHLSWTAWYLFAIVFFWTPVHFWSLALLIQEDYRAVGVPMLPVVYGDRFTATQILAYAWLTSALSWVPAVLGGWNEIYFLASLALDGLLIVWSWQLYRAPERPRALRLYKYSMLYLALLFLALALGRIV